MKRFWTIIIILAIVVFAGCTSNKLEEKGFSVSPVVEGDQEDKTDGIAKDSLVFQTRPSAVLLTGIPQYRLTTIYKVNYRKKDKTPFIGENYYHSNYTHLGRTNGNQWNYNYMPGLEAVSGYNMVNVSHYDIKNRKQKNFFKKPVLIKTLYHPSFSRDTLNYEPVMRNYYMVSVYDQDTNEDGFINVKDLRRFYYFDINAENKTALIPENYGVMRSEYDPANDFMYVYAQLDENKNGRHDYNEALHIFWVDLKNPLNTGRQY